MFSRDKCTMFKAYQHRFLAGICLLEDYIILVNLLAVAVKHTGELTYAVGVNHRNFVLEELYRYRVAFLYVGFCCIGIAAEVDKTTSGNVQQVTNNSFAVVNPFAPELQFSFHISCFCGGL